jgi:hypothetical protein
MEATVEIVKKLLEITINRKAAYLKDLQDRLGRSSGEALQALSSSRSVTEAVAQGYLAETLLGSINKGNWSDLEQLLQYARAEAGRHLGALFGSHSTNIMDPVIRAAEGAFWLELAKLLGGFRYP